MGPSGHFTRMWTRCGCCELFKTGSILGRAPLTKETLPDFHEWRRVIRHPLVFRRLTSCQRTPEKWVVTEGIVRYRLSYSTTEWCSGAYE